MVTTTFTAESIFDAYWLAADEGAGPFTGEVVILKDEDNNTVKLTGVSEETILVEAFNPDGSKINQELCTTEDEHFELTILDVFNNRKDRTYL